MLAELKFEPFMAEHRLHVFCDPGTVKERIILEKILSRKKMAFSGLKEKPVSITLEDGSMISWVMVESGKSEFEKQTLVRKGLEPLLEEEPGKISIFVEGDERLAETVLYATWINGHPLSTMRKKKPKRLEEIFLSGCKGDFSTIRAASLGNILARDLTALPPNELTPGTYRKKISRLAKEKGWEYEEYDFEALRKMGAGAFCAVAQGSLDQDAAIVRISYSTENAKKKIALVGKGICFDTGGHNLKPARYMHGMHEDMNGSAVALGILLAASEAGLDIEIECWLAIAQNHISPKAYKQNDVVKSLNGTTIEIVHTDAEGRMVLADALTLACREKPELLIDFATLTGSMGVALGSRYSGIFGNEERLLDLALQCGKRSGERLCSFPRDLDYEKELESDVADIKQCTLEGDADHILAFRFLSKFVDEGISWLHMDLSSSNCKGGLGAVSTDITGFGVKWGMEFLQEWLSGGKMA